MIAPLDNVEEQIYRMFGKRFQFSMAKWRAETFGPSVTKESTCKKLEEELDELFYAIHHESLERIKDELTDVALMVFALSSEYQQDLTRDMIRKFEELQDKEWYEVSPGVFSKVKENVHPKSRE